MVLQRYEQVLQKAGESALYPDNTASVICGCPYNGPYGGIHSGSVSSGCEDSYCFDIFHTTAKVEKIIFVI
jgi:hypothetical protein